MKATKGAQRHRDKRTAAQAAAEAPPRRRHLVPSLDSDSEGSEPDELAAPTKRARREAVQQQPSDDDSSGFSDSGDSQSDGDDDSSSQGGEPGEQEGLPLGQLVDLRQDGSTSAAAMKARARALRQHHGSAAFKRSSKHKPVEMSSRRPVPVLRDAMQAGKREVRDPRFESLSAGQYSEERFKRRYAFLYDEQLPAEREELRGALRRAKGAAARAQLQARLSRVEQQLRSEEARRKQEAFKQQLKAKEAGAVREGKRPFYLKKSEQRRLELLARYEELRAAGKLEQYMAKRRKRNAAKDHRHLPGGRRPGGGGDGDE